jgi:predicted AAA+ superfamily ATPase
MWPLAQREIRGGMLNVVDELFAGRAPQMTGAPAGRSAFAQVVGEGGYPQARLRPSGRRRDRWFANYVTGTLARDLVELADVRRIDDAERLLRLLATQSANLLSYRGLGARLDMHHDSGIAKRNHRHQPLDRIAVAAACGRRVGVVRTLARVTQTRRGAGG